MWPEDNPLGTAGKPNSTPPPAPDFAFSLLTALRYAEVVPLVRIFIDGYSLLHQWRELAPGKPRHSAAARDELVRILTLYRDSAGTPITVFFDGSSPVLRGPSQTRSTPEMEILFSRAGQTADDMIERAAHRMQPYGEVLVVTDDHAERDTVVGMGGMATSCWNFIQTVADALAEQQGEIRFRNRREQNQFNRRL